MIKLGSISFGIYLWHWVILEFYRYNVSETPGIVAGILIILVSILLSSLMTRFIEKPIRNSNNNKQVFRRLGVIGSVNLLLIGGLLTSAFIDQYRIAQAVTDKNYPGALAAHGQIDVPDEEAIPVFSQVFDDLPQAHLDGSNQGLKESDLKIGEYGTTENYEATIALIGSSHSEQWQEAILEAVKDHPYRVLNLTRSGTRFSTGYDENEMKGIWNNHVLEYLKNADVDLIISQATASHSPTKEVHQQMVDQMQYVKDEYGIAVLAIRDNPRYSFNVLESLETEGIEETADKMNQDDTQNDESFWQTFEKENDSLYKLDLTDYFKVDEEFQPIIGNVIIYRDDNHITNTYAESFGPIFEEKILEILN